MPTTPDEFVPALFVLVVLLALLIVAAGRLVVWAMTAWEARRGVNSFGPRRVRYVAHEDGEQDGTGAPEPAFERPEPATFVQDVQALNAGAWSAHDITRLDTLARLMAAGIGSESTLIPTVYDGQAGVPKVSKGGSAAYTARRDALRAAALSYGWKPPETPPPAPEPRLVLISGGREGSVEL